MLLRIALPSGQNMDVTGANTYTIDRLAQETGVTARNIRAHQSRGLLPPPQLRGRTGHYGAEHVARLRLIQDMQADGLNLKTIKRVLDATPEGGAGALLDLGRAIRRSWDQEQPELITAEELVERLLGGRDDPEVGRRSERLGLIRHLGGGRFEVPSPALLRAGEELVKLGIPIAAGLEVMEQLNRHAEGISRAFIKLWNRHVWEPFVAAGMPEERWPEIQETLERLRPLAGEAVMSTFGQAMTRAADASFEQSVSKVRPRRRSAANPPAAEAT